MVEPLKRRTFLRAGGTLAAASVPVLGLGAETSASATTSAKPRIPGSHRDSADRAHSRAYLGAFHPRSTPGISEPEDLERLLGRRFAINHCFRQPPEAPWAPLRDRMLRDKAAGRIPLLSWAAGEKPGIADHDAAALARLQEIASGRRDPYIDGQARALKALGTPVFLRFTWEFDQRYPGPVGVRAHKAAWRQVHRRFRAVGARNVAFVWCPSWLAFGNDRAAAFYPGDSYVDWVGVDGYARSPDYRTFARLFTAAHSFATGREKPLMVAETGVHRRSGEALLAYPTATPQSTWLDTVRNDLDRGRYPALKALVYFHVDGDNHPQPNQWRVTHPVDGPGLRSFAALAGHPRLRATR